MAKKRQKSCQDYWRSTPRETAFICAYFAAENAGGRCRRGRWAAARHYFGGGDGLRLGYRETLLDEHALHLALRDGSAPCDAHHTHGDNGIGIPSNAGELHVVVPKIEHRFSIMRRPGIRSG
jgi:hypothetical protein